MIINSKGQTLIKLSKFKQFNIPKLKVYETALYKKNKEQILNDIHKNFKGKIAIVKSSKKFRNIESCQTLCVTRNSCAAYTLDTSKGSCTIFKNVSNEVANPNAISGLKK